MDYWPYFDLVKTNSGYFLMEVETEVALTGEDKKIVNFQSFEEARDYLADNDIRGSVRDVVDPEGNLVITQ